MIQCRLAGQEWSMEAFFIENEVKLYDVRRADDATSLITKPVVQIEDRTKSKPLFRHVDIKGLDNRRVRAVFDSASISTLVRSNG